MKVNKFLKNRNNKESEDLHTRITNQNLNVQREEVLKSGRKYKYPLKQSKKSLVTISVSLFLAAVIGFFGYMALALYQFKSDSQFVYQVTKVIPLPIARLGSDFVSYEDYLFELKRYRHYYSTQQELDFSTESAQLQYSAYKKTALQKVIDDAYIRILANEQGIEVSEQEVEQEIEVYKKQNRLGENDEQLEAVLADFYDWSVEDFKISLRQQLLAQKVVAELDQTAQNKAKEALAKARSKTEFSKVVKEYSEDPTTKDKGGEFGFLIDKDSRDIDPKTAEQLFSIKTGEVSEIINVGYGLQIVKKLEEKDGQVKAAQIIINFEDSSTYLNEVKDRVKTRVYVSLD